MSGGLEKIQRNERSFASFSSEVPGSVIAANCLLFPFVWSQKYAKWESVSVVSPDFEATMKSVVAILILERTARIVAGSVVSRTCSLG